MSELAEWEPVKHKGSNSILKLCERSKQHRCPQLQSQRGKGFLPRHLHRAQKSWVLALTKGWIPSLVQHMTLLCRLPVTHSTSPGFSTQDHQAFVRKCNTVVLFLSFKNISELEKTFRRPCLAFPSLPFSCRCPFLQMSVLNVYQVPALNQKKKKKVGKIRRGRKKGWSLPTPGYTFNENYTWVRLWPHWHAS